MRTLRATQALAALALLALLAMASGCATHRQPAPPRPLPASGPIIEGQSTKDATITTAAAAIDEITPEAKPHTDAQRAAIAAAPAADVARLDAEWRATLANRDAHIADLTKRLAAALDATDRVIRLGGYSASALLIAAGVASFFLAAQLAFLGPRVAFALIAAGGSIFAMLQAYDFTKAHPWITALAGLCLFAAAILAYANYLNDRSSRTHAA